jgi:hypothetical protein
MLSISAGKPKTTQSGAGPAINRWSKSNSGELVFQVLLQRLAELRGSRWQGFRCGTRSMKRLMRWCDIDTAPAYESLALCGHGEPGQDWGSA